MFEKAIALLSTSSSSSSPHPSSSSSPHPSSTTGAGLGVLIEAAANCCTGGCGVGCAAFVGAGAGAVGSGAGVPVLEVLIHEESPDRYPLLELADLLVAAMGVGAAGAGPGLTVCCWLCDDVPGAPIIGGSPSSVIRFDSCCMSSSKSRTTRKASRLTSIMGSNSRGIMLGITFVAKSCLVNSIFDVMTDLRADKRQAEKGSFIALAKAGSNIFSLIISDR
mmetsp:Transcript_23433/g.55202  ORF Transcript_23433/g.55202 Transcript_23433/m.55202 type:complete len:221 (+) Transcript_23433:344-1006(+)